MQAFRTCYLCILILVTLLCVSCASDPAPPPPLTFKVTAHTQANAGSLFYFVIRNANDKQFMLETYQDVAGKAFLDPPDPNNLGVFSIVTGTVQECTISPPAQGGIALYFLFTQPGAQWKKLLSVPLLNEYRINLSATSQVGINQDKPWYSISSWF